MALEGTTAAVSIPDLLQLLAGTGKTGTLRLSRNNEWKQICLRDGLVLAVSSSRPDEYLSHLMLSLGKVSTEDMGEALVRQGQVGTFFGLLLVEDGKLTADELRGLLRESAYGSAASLLEWTQASFRFEEFTLPGSRLLPLDLNVQELLLESARRIDEIERLRERLAVGDQVFTRSGSAPVPAPGLLGEPLCASLLGRLDRPLGVAELREELRASEYLVLEALGRLVDAGLVTGMPRPAPAARPPRAAESTSEPRVVEEAQQLLRNGRSRQAAEMLRSFLLREPTRRVARDLLARAEQMVVEELTRGPLPLGAVPVLAVPLDSLADRSLSPAEAFLLTRLGPAVTVEALLDAVPLAPAETLLALERLERGGYLAVRKPPPVRSRPGVDTGAR